MKANSRSVSTTQTGIHQNLHQTVRRHLAHKYRKPPTALSTAAFSSLASTLKDHKGPFILDSFCGTGQSTKLLAERHPEHFVVGVDKSAHRLGKHQGTFDTIHGDKNYLLLQAQCEDIWHLLLKNSLHPQAHYLLYPNPWPKPAHLQRRIHGNGAFSWLLKLGGRIEIRSNWKLYLQEFAIAMDLGGRSGELSALAAQPALTLFEQKYRDSGHPLWAYMSNKQN